MFRFAHTFRWTLAALIALAALGVGFGTAAAAPVTPPEHPTRGTAALERRFKAEQNRLKGQRERLDRLVEHAPRFDERIAKAKAKGKDTSSLEQALATARSELEKARAEWQAAADILTTHAGFDDAGKVVDAEQARATLENGRAHMQQAHEIAHNALKNLRAAVVAFRQANHAEPVAPTPTEP